MSPIEKRVPAVERLRKLPPAFSGKQAGIVFGWDTKATSHYLWLWKKQGLILGLGGHSDVFCNLIASPSPNWEEAMLMACPSATIIGMESLRRKHWTTQIPSLPNVAISSAGPRYTVDYFHLEARNPEWYQSIQKARDSHPRSLPVLPPAWALADMIFTPGCATPIPAPDDIEWDAIGSRDQVQWKAACKALGGAGAGNIVSELNEETYAQIYNVCGPFAKKTLRHQRDCSEDPEGENPSP